MKRLSRPMTRADWAWIMACVVSGLFCALLAVLSEIGADQSQSQYGAKYTFTTTDGKPGVATEEQVVEPVYATKITILTNGRARDITDAIAKLGLQETELRVSSVASNHLKTPDYITIAIGGIFLFLMASYLFRILERACGRILGVKPAEGSK